MFPGCDDLGLPGDSHMCCGLHVQRPARDIPHDVFAVHSRVVHRRLVGNVFSGAFLSAERDIVWEGSALVEEDQGYLGTRFAYYPRVGPLLKGRETVYVTYEVEKRLCLDQ